MHAENEGLDSLFDLNALGLDLLRQAGQRVLNATLSQQQIGIRVCPDFKNRGDYQLAITRRLAADIVHALHAVDGLLERRRYRACDGLGRGAGVCRDYLDGWRDNVRVLGDRQDHHRRQAEHQDENIDDRSEPRMINEEMRDFHDLAGPWL
jgi:hypothetical protein